MHANDGVKTKRERDGEKKNMIEKNRQREKEKEEEREGGG